MVSGPHEIWSGDLIDMTEFSNDNKDYNYCGPGNSSIMLNLLMS